MYTSDRGDSPWGLFYICIFYMLKYIECCEKTCHTLPLHECASHGNTDFGESINLFLIASTGHNSLHTCRANQKLSTTVPHSNNMKH